MNTRAAAVASLVLLAGCGGGGSSTPAPNQPLLPNAPATSSPRSAGTATLTIGVPRTGSSAQRAPKYVSPNSALLDVTVKTVNGQPPTATQVPPPNPQTFTLSTAPGGNCTNAPSGETCTVTVPAPTGQVTYQFDLYDAGKAHKLATNTLTYTIAPGSTQNLQAVLNGIVATVSVITPTLNAGTSFSGPITVQAFDGSGALIVGSAPYSNPFTLTDNDATGATSLTNGGTTALTVTVGSPNDVVILNFDGQDIDPFTISSTIPGGSAQTAGTVQITHSPVTFPGTPNDTQRTTDPNYNQPTLAFTSIPSTKAFTAAQVGWSDHGTHGFTVALDPATCGSGAAAVVTVVPAPGTNNRTFNVTSKNPGVCKGTVTGGPPGNPQSATIWFSVSATNLILN